MSDQADQLRKLVRQAVHQCPAMEPGVPLVVISGGKGGVGTTTVATELAQELGALGKRTVLVDANPQQPDIATHLGIEPRGCLADVLEGTRTAVETLRPLDERVQVLPGRWAADSLPELSNNSFKRLIGELRGLHSRADLILLDAGSGMSPWVGQLWKAAQQVLLVSTGESVAVMDSYAAVKLSPWGDVDGKVRLVINRCDDSNAAKRIGERFESTCRRFLGIHVATPVALATCPDMLAAITERAAATTDRDYRRTVRLLAAEVISDSQVVAARLAKTPKLDLSLLRGKLAAELTNNSLQNSK